MKSKDEAIKRRFDKKCDNKTTDGKPQPTMVECHHLGTLLLGAYIPPFTSSPSQGEAFKEGTHQNVVAA
jgi:hypothetical protein